ncbi:MAG: DUF4835 family protein [Bacteroidetes bacterium]|nr:DUF4835 family protein [Bacteroidota bacterium]
MRRAAILLFIWLSGFRLLTAQDLNCMVDIVHPQVQTTSAQIFDDLKNAVTQFMNNRKWITGQVDVNEKIECNLVIDITKFEVDVITANFNFQSSRTVYNTTYNTRVLSYVDNQVVFTYARFQNLEYQDNSYTSNLTSVLAFYAYMIIGLDFDTYQLNGGDPYFKKALNVRDLAMNAPNSPPGWASNDGNGSKNKYFLIDNMLDQRFKPLRAAMYRYHIKGLDVMTSNMEEGREEIYLSLKDLKIVRDALPNALFLKLFFNAKSDELIQIFSQATPSQKVKVVELLSTMDPANRSRYEDGIMKAK